MPNTTPAPAGPLAGVKILDLTSVILGPFATQILAQLGADVVKLEPPEGDNLRHVGPMRNAGMGHIFLHANAGKRSIALDLKHPAGREAALRLAEGCDLLISNVRPQALARLGLDYEAVRARNPRIIHVSCCGFDQQGPDAARPAYDDLIQGATGIPWLMQQYGAPEPAYAPTTLADRVTGLHAVYAVTAALYARERTGRGQAIVVPMFEAMAQFVLGDHMAGQSFDPPLGGPGYARLLSVHRRPYATQDGMLCVLIYNDKHWRSFFAAIGESEGLARDPRFATHGARAVHIDAVYAEVARILRTRSTAAWRTLLDAADVPNMPMHSPQELLTHPQLRATGFVHECAHPSEGRLHALATPTRWSDTPPARSQSPAPRLGEHTCALLAEAGYSAAQIDALLAQGACRAAAAPGSGAAEAAA
ncbi:CoA transferase [Verminephrobacter aporrectodeae subsp. tuberculatae]|uniref:CaiB/BaiF CoA transferase family protein n=2 Tax=Verminephrobacter aporrectodeae TaxID=1110389 RepID=UPI002237A179|nr:CoA transferase [Verminephrobacter aporrectodeae]MCW5221125.1 CoA transferase [Verminephrobacter aporrectodeae subsp. tuberculatae]MCW5290416.1 CoA transferase [Verminephrobacter aporrectodeae subsp. tuberculatae]MCW8164968.1 CoA transferase [Verminephrobacter aporrectodeae subsp. tuberculatae]MCW8167916.1 CoA transferase [Verminephrobacter aporrectodeae subsp. tuberculatae]